MGDFEHLFNFVEFPNGLDGARLIIDHLLLIFFQILIVLGLELLNLLEFLDEVLLTLGQKLDEIMVSQA